MTLYALFLFSALNQGVRAGSNVAILLTALSLQASPIVVGALTALSGLLPMLLAVVIGRLNDRFGARPFLLAGSMLVMVSMALPALWPGLPALFVTATLVGLGTMSFSLTTQSTVGLMSGPENRTRNFSWLSISYSVGAVIGPMLAGPLIDLAGYQTAFTALAVLPVLALAVVASGRLALPPPRKAGAGREAPGVKGAFDLLRAPRLRTIYLLTALHVSAWEVFSFLVPVYGAGIGLAATSIGLILGSFAAATFFVRIVMPFFSRRFPPLALIKASLVLAGIHFIFFPMVSSVPMLAALAFTLGLGLGITQPLAMTALHEATPAGRTGEAVGLRAATVNLTGTATPLLYGALGTAAGMAPVFWGVAAALWIAVWALS